VERKGAISTLLVDAHVHFHPCYELQTFLDSTHDNLTQAAASLKLLTDTPGCLLMAECAWHNYFSQFAKNATLPSTSHWSIHPTEERESLLACRNGQPRILLVSGRQIVTAERLEVLALACDASFQDGQSIENTLAQTTAQNAVTVLPWGLGKWWGRRGRIVEQILHSHWAEQIFLGDNAGRPTWPRDARLFQLARQRGVPILPGTDPLNLQWQQSRAGRYGFVIANPITLNAPAASLRQFLLEHRLQPTTFGRRESLRRILRANLGLRMQPETSPIHSRNTHA
jgi:hypothetical protein